MRKSRYPGGNEPQSALLTSSAPLFLFFFFVKPFRRATWCGALAAAWAGALAHGPQVAQEIVERSPQKGALLTAQSRKAGVERAEALLIQGHHVDPASRSPCH